MKIKLKLNYSLDKYIDKMKIILLLNNIYQKQKNW